MLYISIIFLQDQDPINEQDAMGTPNVEITRHEAFSVQVHSKAALNVVYNDNRAIQNKHMSMYLKSLYIDFDGLKMCNALQRKYKEFKNSSKQYVYFHNTNSLLII